MSELGLVFAEAAPSPALRPYVTRLVAYRERYAAPLTRAEAAIPGAVLVLGFGASMEVAGERLTSFAGGLADRFTVTRVTGQAEGVEVFLTPFGARRLYDVPMRHVTNVTLPVEDLLGPWARTAVARMAEISSWSGRLALADRLLTERVLDGPEPDPRVRWAWARLLRTGGDLGVSSLAGSLGWSHRHLVARFHDQVGLTPKAAARVIRFGRAAHRLRAGATIAQVAAECGFYDQAHMNREFRTLGDTTPGQICPRPRPASGAH